MRYLVRDGFYPQVTMGKNNNVQNFSGGDIIDLTPEQYELIKHMVEPAPPPAKESK